RLYGEAQEQAAIQASLGAELRVLAEAEQAARRAAERAAGHFARLQAVTAALGAAATPPDVADVVLGQAVPALGAHAGQVWVLSADGAELAIVGARGYPTELLEPWRR